MAVPKKIDYTLMDLLCSFETEGQLLRHVAAQLAIEPFNKDVTFSTLAHMSYDEAFQIFNDVLVEIDPKQNVDISSESHDARFNRLVELFSILKYKPRNGDAPVKYVYQFLERRNVHFLWELLSWIFIHFDDLKKRAYLSDFLVKIIIPSDFLLDSEIADAYASYENKIEEFKYIHKQCESLKTNTGIAELMKDTSKMDHDISCLSRKLENVKARIPSSDRNKELYLEDAHKLNVERTRKKELRAQVEEDTRILNDLELKCYYRESTLQELKKYNNTTCGDLLIQHLVRNYENFKYMVDEKIPFDIMSLSRAICAMEIVEAEGEALLSDSYLESLQQKVFDIKGSIVDMEESRKRKGEVLMLEKLRADAKMIAMRKALWKENIEKMIQDCLKLRKTLEEKRFEKNAKAAQKSADKALYHKVHGMVDKYKKMRLKMINLQTEVGVLKMTRLILDGELTESEIELEDTMGGQMDSQTISQSGSIENNEVQKTGKLKAYNEETLRFLSQQSTLHNELREKVCMKKLEVEPLINRIEDRRQELCILELQYNKCRGQFESEIMASEEPIRTKTEWIKSLKQQIQDEELLHCELVATISKQKYLLSRAAEEPDDSEELEIVEPSGMAHLRRGVYSFKAKLLTQIVEQERIEGELNEQLAYLDETQAMRYNQLEMWSDLRRILQEKCRPRQQAISN